MYKWRLITKQDGRIVNVNEQMKLDMVVITETTPTSSSTMTTTSSLSRPGCSIFANLESDTQRNIRGVAVYTKTSLSIPEVEMEIIFQNPFGALCVIS